MVTLFFQDIMSSAYDNALTSNGTLMFTNILQNVCKSLAMSREEQKPVIAVSVSKYM